MITDIKIVDDGDNIIGTRDNIIEYFRQEINRQFTDTETITDEEFTDNCEKVLNIVRELRQKDNERLLKVNYGNSFGDLFLYDFELGE